MLANVHERPKGPRLDCFRHLRLTYLTKIPLLVFLAKKCCASIEGHFEFSALCDFISKKIDFLKNFHNLCFFEVL